MSIAGMFVLGVGLALDAAAAAAARGLAARRVTVADVALVAGLFAGFQMLMPLLGWTLGGAVGAAVAAWDHWVAFVLLGGLGLSTTWEALRGGGDDEAPADGDPFGLRVLLVLAFATSVDAFAAGVTLPLLDVPLLPAVAVIGATTAVLSALGVAAGRRFGAMLGRGLEAAGGLVLLLLGTKILLEHLGAA